VQDRLVLAEGRWVDRVKPRHHPCGGDPDSSQRLGRSAVRTAARLEPCLRRPSVGRYIASNNADRLPRSRTMIRVEKIDHIHVFVRDLDKAIKLFEEVLGTKFTEPEGSEKLDARTAMEPIGFELIEGLSKDGAVNRAIERRGEGLAAISLKVPDIEEAIAHLEAKGIRLVRRLEGGKIKEAQFHPKDTFGVMLELCEYEIEHGAHIASRMEP
jgi:methylmalonyl-CoA/ethylmalonyl-CoA epimerase